MEPKFWLDGKRCDEVGIRLQRAVQFSGTKPKMETVSVPGRNGDLHYYEGAFENVEGTASCFALSVRDVDKALSAISQFSLLEPGYHRLETTEEPEVFRKAAIVSGAETEIRMRTLAPFSIGFNCMPQKFLKQGEKEITLSESGEVLLNNWFPALPVITVSGKGAGSLTINGTTVTFKSNFAGPIVLDCELQDAYYNYSNKNAEISAAVFPTLPNGKCTISWTGGVTGVKIIPRWWTL